MDHEEVKQLYTEQLKLPTDAHRLASIAATLAVIVEHLANMSKLLATKSEASNENQVDSKGIEQGSSSPPDRAGRG